MSPSSSLTFSGWHWLWPAIAFLIVALAILGWSYRAAAGQPYRWLCLTLKALGIAALAVCLLEPLWLGQRAQPGANMFAVLADNSQGLQIRDEGQSESRGESLRALVDPGKPGWQSTLAENFDVRRYAFAARLQPTEDFRELDFKGRSSAIGGALQTVKERFANRPLAGVLLLTDGNATDLPGDALPDFTGLPPVYPIVIGRTDAVRDVSIQQVHVTQTAFEDAPVTIQADVIAAGFRGQPVRAELLDQNGRTVGQQSLDGRGDGGPLAFRFQLKPERSGLSYYKVRVSTPEQPPVAAGATTTPGGEATLANNSRVVVVDRGQEAYRVLYVSGRPNWEFKFLNRALDEDPQVRMVALIRVAKREPKFDFRGRAGETSNPLFRGFGDQSSDEVQRYDQPVLVRLNTRDEVELRAGFPRTAEELYGYHAVILDDLEAEFFGADQAQLLQKFVSERGGGVLMLGGMESFQEGGYARTPIGDMLPVYLERGEEAAEAPGPLQLQLAREGWLQPWARLRDNEADERGRLEAMESFQILNRVRSLKPGASVIATVRDQHGAELPALAVQRFGRGRTAALMVGDVWRWGMRDVAARADMDKAWRQLVRWLVSDVPGRVQATVEPVAADANGAVQIQVRVRDEKFLPVDDAAVAIAIEPVGFEGGGAPEAGGIKLEAEPALSEPGLYQATYVPRTTGGFRATAAVSDHAGVELGSAEVGWSTDLAAEEFRSLVPNTALLEEIARKTGGEVVPAAKLADFAERLPQRRAPVMETWSYPAWHSPVMFAFALGCLLAEWGIRRWKGLP